MAMPLAVILFVIGWLIWEKIRKRETWRGRDRLWLFILCLELCRRKSESPSRRGGIGSVTPFWCALDRLQRTSMPKATRLCGCDL
jgi:hypothetical protein